MHAFPLLSVSAGLPLPVLTPTHKTPAEPRGRQVADTSQRPGQSGFCCKTAEKRFALLRTALQTSGLQASVHGPAFARVAEGLVVSEPQHRQEQVLGRLGCGPGWLAGEV